MGSIQQIIFMVLSVIALASALGVVLSKNPVTSVLCLIVTFFAIAGHYVMMNAQFLAVVHIIVYAGAIMVLFLYVLMLMNLNAELEPQKRNWLKYAGAISGGALLVVLVAALRDASMPAMSTANNDIGLVHNLGMVLFRQYVVPFEVSSILFLSAMIGAVVIGRKED
ncbi:NADH-quinone oxidoreductase subunit J [Chitinophaga terrae (ex Kim and Jung 2007)]|jgi:NADH-quinone oxidoreductase subunit J|uniref:NADH-quinone oxidoreductase subunit J n=1 Tax=Chitinophaga terrae (ex Kim and Jung 2007) TaxID=408074 RepID=A0A1H4DNL4_9BACT|nr:NADH-quinone oxidoreductase subunit J [Chitinophaga terrae (ex Kim and Jung 2007)]MDQ0107842.1 NADH-quinone oxidoreductase subunit J [Chitinophaga terrae (ex Kim and Jung 2007)]GEP91016.1 NADH dehydrogenase subunit J [Chitinophaga terrae (ex Kim and Jung 2007)]SEA74108.1 NADH-quinone oxidoreductase subunit J [Chitinophaga terrae (ex Kim and Jung 2007)]